MMTIDDDEENVIYESPDGGRTVYARTHGSKDRELVSSLPQKDAFQRWIELRDAVAMAEVDSALDEAIKRVEILYALKR